MKTFLFIFASAFCFLAPFVCFCIWRKKTNCSWTSFVVGVFFFSVFAITLEGFANYFLVTRSVNISSFFTNHPFLYAIYGGLMAGLFEESGRFICFKTILKNKPKQEAIAYGLGHSECECVLSVGITYLLYAVYSLGFSLGDPTSDALIGEIVNTIDSSLIIFAIIERIASIILHLGLSIIVYKAVNDKKSLYLYPCAIILHMLIDIPAGLYQIGVIDSIFLIELFTVLFAIIVLYVGINIYRNIKKC